MTPAQVAATLRQFNEWRRGELDDLSMPDPREIGEAIDAAIEMIERIEAAEKSDAESLTMYRKARDERDALRAALRHEADCVEAAKAEIEALRAKIAAMEQQEPARLVTAVAYRWRYRGAVMWQYGELTEETTRRAKEHNHEVQPLYTLPGAHPAQLGYVPASSVHSVIHWLRNGCDPMEAADELEMLTAAPEAKP